MRKSPYQEVHVFFPPALHRRLRLASVEVKLSMQQIIRNAVAEWFDRQERAGVAVPPVVPEMSAPYPVAPLTMTDLGVMPTAAVPHGTPEVVE